MSPLLLSDGWPAEEHEREVASLGERVALLGLGPGLLESLWVTYRRRTLLRAAIIAAARGARRPRFVEDELGSLPMVRPPLIDSTSAAEALFALWSTGGAPRAGARADALLPLAERWRKEGSEVVYLLMPISSALRQALRARGLWDFATERLDPIVAAHGGRVLDCRAAVADDAFYDGDHLREGPARSAFSRRLGALIASGATSCDAARTDG
jgi:hypothetical protein